MKATAILSICCALLLIIFGWTATYSMERINALTAQVSSAQQDAERWRVTAHGWQGKVQAQSSLAAACLKRESAAVEDATLRDSILQLAPPVTLNPHELQQGVSRETRRAAAEYLNRPL